MGNRSKFVTRLLCVALLAPVALAAVSPPVSLAQSPGDAAAVEEAPPIAVTDESAEAARRWLEENIRRDGTLPRDGRLSSIQIVEEITIRDCELHIRLVREYPSLKRRIAETAVIPLSQLDPLQVRARPYRSGEDLALLRLVARKDAQVIQVTGIISNEGVPDEPFSTREATYAFYLTNVLHAGKVALAIADVVRRCGGLPDRR
jgi:hypothetical protein